MKKILFILSVLILASCGQGNVEPQNKDSVSYAEIKEVDTIQSVDINPVFMVTRELAGTDFGNFFKTLYTQGKYDDMIKFTSKSSLDKFGEEKVLEFYKNDLKFGYELGKPHSQTIDGDTITLNYDANIIATKRVVRIKVLIENDSCKIVLPNKLTNFPS